MPDADARPTDRRWLLVALVVVLPIVSLVIALSGRTWYPTGDQAQAELRMLSLPEQPPLVGAAGRIQDEARRQGNHPGPLMFWATWPFYVALGQSAWAFEAATALINVLWLAGAVALVKRRAGLGACAWFGAVALILIGGFGLDALSQPWNPWVSLLPFTVLVLATWSAIEGDRWAPPLAVAAASYALQGHVGYLPLAIPLCAVALAAPVWRWFRGTTPSAPGGPPESDDATDDDADSDSDSDSDDSATSGRSRAPLAGWLVPLAVSLCVGAIAWSGPLWDVARNDPNNVSKLIANFSNPSDAPIGVQRGIEAVFQSASPVGAWVWGGAEVAGSAWPGKLFLLVWAVVAVLVARRGDRPALSRLNALLTATMLVGMFAVSRIFGVLYLYTFRWIVVIIALQIFTLGWGIATLLPRPSPTAARRLAGIAAVALVALSATMAVRFVRQDIPYDQSWRAEQVLAPKVANRLDRDTRYLVQWDDPAYLGGLGFGLILDLERRGFDVGGLPQFDAAIEPHRVRCVDDVDEVLTVVTGADHLALYRSRPDLQEIAATDPREDPEAWDRTAHELIDVLNAAKPASEPPETMATLENKLNLLLLAPGQPREVTDLAADLVLSGVPSAVFLGTTETVDFANPNTSHPC